MNKFLAFLIFLSLLTGGIWVARDWHTVPLGDGLHYDVLATSLVEEGRFAEDGQLSARRDPGYSFFIAGIYKFTGIKNYGAVRIAQLMLFVLICVQVYLLTREIFGSEKIARIAGLLSAFFYPLAFYTSLFFTEILFTLVLLGAMYALLLGGRTNKKVYYVMAGLLFGFSVLVKSVMLYYVILLVAGFLLVSKNAWKKTFVGLGIFLIFSSAVVLPWMWRNHSHFGSFSVSDQDGVILYFAVQRLKISNADLPKVLVANTLGDFFAQKFFGEYNRQAVEEGDFGRRHTQLTEAGLTEQELDTVLLEESKAAIYANPLRYLLVVPPIEFLKLHTPIFPFESVQGLFSDPGRYQGVPDAVKGLIILSVRLIYWAFFALVIYGIIKSRDYRKDLVFVYLLLIYIIGVYSVLHGIPRYLLPLYPVYIIFFSYAIHHIYESIHHRRLLGNR